MRCSCAHGGAREARTETERPLGPAGRKAQARRLSATMGEPARWRARCAIRVRQLAADRSAHLRPPVSGPSKIVSMLPSHQPAARGLVATVADEGTPATSDGRGCCRVSTRSQRGARRRRRAGARVDVCGAGWHGLRAGRPAENSSEDLQRRMQRHDKQRTHRL